MSAENLLYLWLTISFVFHVTTQIIIFMRPTWGPHGSYRPQVGHMLTPWTLLSGYTCTYIIGDGGVKSAYLYIAKISEFMKYLGWCVFVELQSNLSKLLTNILNIHWKRCIPSGGENLTALRFQSLSAHKVFLNRKLDIYLHVQERRICLGDP